VKFGTDGVRGVAHAELTTDFAERLARAAAVELATPSGTVVVGGDTRESTPDFVRALSDGFRAEAVDVVDLGVVPTPMVAFESQRRQALGAMVSASHNHYLDNGIKLFASGGTKLSDDVQQRIEGWLERGETPPPSPRRGTAVHETDRRPYTEHVLSILEGRRLDGLRVVLDCANGAAHDVAPAVVRATGAEVQVIADRPDGRNINSGCGATDTAALAARVRATDADVGLALDGDADRLIAVDHTGRIVDGDHLIAICAEDLRARELLRDHTVVVTVMSNLGFRHAMAAADIQIVETPVGDRYVLEALTAGRLSLGGEQSGHVIFADHATTGDGMLTGLALLDAVARAGRPLADVAAAAMTSLPQVLRNVRVETRRPDVVEVLDADIRRAQERLGEQGRILVRPSGTEPLIRVMVEAPTVEEAERTAAELAAVIEERFTGAR
jgi:phosphoglucosamine mutase